MLKLPMHIRRQTGVGLIELMVGLTVGLLVTVAVLAVYSTALFGGSITIKSAKLNIEMRSAMDLMTSEIRRAGYRFTTATSSPGSNPFMSTNGVLTVPTSSCVLYAYDTNDNGNLDSADQFGFKAQDGAIWMKSGGGTTAAGCNVSSDGWERITDQNETNVSSLTFTASYSCTNSQTNAAENDACVSGNAAYDAAASNTDMIETRQINIELSATHEDDTELKLALNQVVLVRNHRVVNKP